MPLEPYPVKSNSDLWKLKYPMFKTTLTEYNRLHRTLNLYMNCDEFSLCYYIRLGKVSEVLRPSAYLHRYLYGLDSGYFTYQQLKYMRYIWLIKLINYNRKCRGAGYPTK